MTHRANDEQMNHLRKLWHRLASRVGPLGSKVEMNEEILGMMQEITWYMVENRISSDELMRTVPKSIKERVCHMLPFDSARRTRA